MYTIKLMPEELTTIQAALEHYKLDLKNDPLRPKVVDLALNLSYQQTTEEAFETAILQGILSRDVTASNYVGNYMYMGVSHCKSSVTNGREGFKHIMSRKYVWIDYANKEVDITD